MLTPVASGNHRGDGKRRNGVTGRKVVVGRGKPVDALREVAVCRKRTRTPARDRRLNDLCDDFGVGDCLAASSAVWVIFESFREDRLSTMPAARSGWLRS